MMQIRNVPDPIHRELKARAARAGMSLSDYVLAELRRALERPPREEILARLAKRTRVEAKPGSVAAIRAERDAR